MPSTKVKFKTPSQIRAESPGEGGPEIRGEAVRVFARMDYLILMRAAEQNGRALLADEAREYDQLETLYDVLCSALQASGVPEGNLPHATERPGAAGRDPDSTRAAGGRAYAEGHPLAKDQTFTGYVAAMGHKEPREVQDALESLERPLSLTKCLRGAYTGDWRDAEPERIMMALSGASAGAGGVMLPTILVAHGREGDDGGHQDVVGGQRREPDLGGPGQLRGPAAGQQRGANGPDHGRPHRADSGPARRQRRAVHPAAGLPRQHPAADHVTGPAELTVGTSTDTSDVFTADWTQLMIGVRTQLQITILNERYMPGAGAVRVRGLVAR